MKAALSVLIHEKESEEIIEKIENLFFQNSSIYLDIKEQQEFDQSKNEFMKFLERDEREAMKMVKENTNVDEIDKYKWPL